MSNLGTYEYKAVSRSSRTPFDDVAMLNRLGAERWCLVSVEPHIFWFRRYVPAKPAVEDKPLIRERARPTSRRGNDNGKPTIRRRETPWTPPIQGDLP